ncbi:Hercynine oxygenase [Candidatus Magnetaquicoccaceae bacterium FCR-1]|uniref:Hercynine oxygenase n=1 Tax=Candidatus Magnetaquiglobus chichijimensis TaxID=3141448 RepID=A0ABQ0CB15_9PROT
MKSWAWLALIGAAWASGAWAEGFDSVSRDVPVQLAKDLHQQKRLGQGKRVAVAGFTNALDGKGCQALSYYLGESVSATLQTARLMMTPSFEIVVRRNLEPVEAEYTLQGKKIDPARLRKAADLLITGSWLDGLGKFRLTVKAVELAEGGAVELTSVVKEVDKSGLPEAALRCLPGPKQFGLDQNEEVRVLQEKINDLNTQIESLRQNRDETRRKKEMESVIAKQKQTIKELLKKGDDKGTVQYTDRTFSENLAFLNLETSPTGMEVYVDGAFIGFSPIKKYEIEAGKEYMIVAKGDPRYWRQAELKRSFQKMQRDQYLLRLTRARGKVLLLGDEMVDGVVVDGKVIRNFDPKNPVIEVNAGKRRIGLFSPRSKSDSNHPTMIEVDVWEGDLLRKDVVLTGSDLITKNCSKIKPEHGIICYDEVANMKFVYIDKGNFQIGCVSEIPCDERLFPSVALNPYWMAITEVNQGQWRAVRGYNPAMFQTGDDYPVEQVSWNEARAFAQELSQKGGKCRYDLPTEAQWEYACRSGGYNEEYCGGKDVYNLAWYEMNSGQQTHPVGEKDANGLGIHDMSGNVWEWTCSDYEVYQIEGKRYAKCGEGARRVIRGGSWYSNSSQILSTDRSYNTQKYNSNNIGFRLARICP